ncbi:chorismate synthase [Phosphitispora fastidiosa]|uniref:chorismate synthase n=1 Tax=Phosphitispora fastidiosa TaxID=2837202 RepID=UPI001E572C19|nr:chorismate synthase [Phosphitispora fastidiosa]MBU7008763.1 chorismate synthase [Phosphitispora fastidiosa]
MLRYLTAGESHGRALTALVEGLPAGVPLTEDYINSQLARRQGGYGRGDRMKIEKDRVSITAGVRGGLSTGGPVSLVIENRDWANWSEVMSPGDDARLDERVVTKPRPGHADLGGALKYGHTDIRNILERASARETAARVAAGTAGRALAEQFGIRIFGHVTVIGSIEISEIPGDTEEIFQRAAQSELLCADSATEAKMKQEIDRCRDDGDSLGGIFEIIVTGLPPGLGSHVQYDRRLDGRLAQAVMSIQAIKGVEFGIGFRAGRLTGSQVHDELFYSHSDGFRRNTNRAGGLEGGITNGEPLVLRAVMKPIPTLYKPLRSVDMHTKEPYEASIERSDVCAVPAAVVVGEAVVCFEIARSIAEKFGGDSLAEMKRNYDAYVNYVKRV